MTAGETFATLQLVVTLLLALLCVWQAARIDELETNQHDQMAQPRDQQGPSPVD